MLSEQTVSLLQTAATWAAVACALIAVWRQNQTARALMRLQLSVQIVGLYDSENMQRIRARLARQLLTDLGTRSIDDSVILFLENVAHLARRQLLDRAFVWNHFGFDIPYYWAAHSAHVQDLRKKYSDDSLYEEVERMAKHLSQPQRSPLGTRVPGLSVSE